ncbi:uncharacterized protein B0T23DRAFT_326052 [Neurospora hispaniola]|uniref:Uncharacterized protein n=1 Tax=Neurospora hispaniola TaxID=588809 RepID=A0AAJ0MM44_9PEZI|nr:hypothetical protein B0T23DRAFT_326052 [Neurospora hispaniola]
MENTLVGTRDLGHSEFTTTWRTLSEEPTTQRPLVGPEQKLMIQALTGAYSSNFSLCICLPDVMKISIKNPAVVLHSTANSLADDIKEGREEYAVLLHAIPTGLRDSLIQGTLVHDYVTDSVKYIEELGDRGTFPGVYAVGIAFRHRYTAERGAFLNYRECTQVISILENYAAAYRLLATSHEGSQLPPEAEQVIKDARELDKTCGYPHEAVEDASAGTTLHYLPTYGSANIHKLEVFIESFKRRAKALQKLDNTGSTYMHQGPLYVGCTAGQMSERMKQHHYEPSMPALPMKNMFLALTMGALLQIGLKPYTVGVPILPVWVGEHLPLAERLVTMLASSLISQDGFNGIQAGSKAGQDCDEAGLYVAEETTYFKNNLDRTLADADQFFTDTEGVDHLRQSLQFVKTGELERKLSSIELLLSEMEESTAMLKQMGARFQIGAELRQAQERHRAIIKQYRFNSTFVKLLRSMTRRLNLDDDTIFVEASNPWQTED